MMNIAGSIASLNDTAVDSLESSGIVDCCWMQTPHSYWFDVDATASL